MTSGVFRPSMLKRGSYFPGPHDRNTAFCAGVTTGDSAIMAPTVRSVAPTIEPAAYAGRQRVVHRRVTEGAGDAEFGDVILLVNGGLNAHDRIQFQQRHGRRGTREIDSLENSLGQYRRVNLETDAQRRCRIYALFYDLVKTKCVGPELVVAVGIETKDVAAVSGSLAGLIGAGGCGIGIS